MRLIFISTFALALAGHPAVADCTTEIAAMFSGGPFDPFERPNRRETTISIAPDGSETPVSDVLWDGPTRSINCYASGCAMAIDGEMWLGDSFDGPWTPAPTQAPSDPEAFVRQIADDLGANITEAHCNGSQTLGDGAALQFVYRTKTNPNEFGSWFGGLFTAWIDPDTGRLVRLEETESVASWAPEPNPAVKVTTVIYDDAISVTRPGD